MYTRFYDDTIVTRFIKYFLANTYTPLVRVWNPGQFTMQDSLYLYQGNILQAKITGVPTSIKRDFDIKKIFIPDRSYHGINSTYISNTSSYDPVTHRWLGNYLRFLRDYYHVNLMPFYNCFCGEFVSNIDIRKVTGENSSETFYKVVSGVHDETSKVFIVPVKFGTTYNLALECDTKVEFMYAFYGPKGLIQSPSDALVEDIGSAHYTSIPSCKFTTPYVVPAVEWEGVSGYTQNVAQFERYLRLFVKMPVDCNSSIAVIEGDISRNSCVYGKTEEESFTDFSSITGVNTTLLKTCNSKTVEGNLIPQATLYFDESTSRQTYSSRPIEDCLGPLGLLQWSDGNTYAFSNRLVEYLLLNVIDSQESISGNIERVQERSTSFQMSNANLFPYYKGAYTPGVWDEDLQKYLYALRVSTHNIPKGNPNVDFNGFVDKDLESILNRGGNR